VTLTFGVCVFCVRCVGCAVADADSMSHLSHFFQIFINFLKKSTINNNPATDSYNIHQHRASMCDCACFDVSVVISFIITV